MGLVTLSAATTQGLKILAASERKTMGALAEEAVVALLKARGPAIRNDRCAEAIAQLVAQAVAQQAPYAVSEQEIDWLISYGRSQGNVISVREAMRLLHVPAVDARAALRAIADRKLGIIKVDGQRVRLQLAPPRDPPKLPPTVPTLPAMASESVAEVSEASEGLDAEAESEKLRAAMVVLEAEAGDSDGAAQK